MPTKHALQSLMTSYTRQSYDKWTWCHEMSKPEETPFQGLYSKLILYKILYSKITTEIRLGSQSTKFAKKGYFFVAEQT